MNALRRWYQAVRPPSFTASIVPVVLGTLLAAQTRFSPWLFVITLAGSMALQAGTNLLNDYFDFVHNVDRVDAVRDHHLMHEGALRAVDFLRGGLLALALGSAAGIYLAITTGWPVLAIGLAGVIVCYFYTAPPLSFSRHAAGEVVVGVSMGPLMIAGAYYVQLQRFEWQLLVLALPVLCLTAAILHANNIRDIADDLRVDKRTLANVLGMRGARSEYLALTGGAYAALAAGIAARQIPWPALLAFATLPMAWALIRQVWTGGSEVVYHRILRQTGRLHLRFGTLLALGLLAPVVAGRL
ncbi:MAG: 1,4-dihydroxy-2-naphthoate octaprenyltransferase [Chloroflexi bacterium]|nr:1,4-dihydroxy-2-naphthoate octaprenyltransferase [Chloroflexota bacterium]